MMLLRRTSALGSVLPTLLVAVGLLAAPAPGLAAPRTVLGEMWSQDN